MHLFAAGMKGKRDAVSEISGDRLSEGLLVVLIICLVFLQKINLSPNGVVAISVAYPIMLGVLVIGVLSGRLVLRAWRAVWFLACAGVFLAIQLAQTDFSILALGLVLFIHMFYVVGLKAEATRPDFELRMFQKVAGITAVVGILQFLAQFVIGVEYAFLIDRIGYKPPILVQGMPAFNSIIPISSGSSVYKTNGLFLLEPSFMCQLMAVAIIIEVAYFRSLRRLALFVVAITLTFSGTGLVVLGLLLPFLLVREKRFGVCLFLVIMTVTVQLWAPLVGLDNTLQRVAEFGNPHSSGSARFISPFWQLRDFVLPSEKTLLVGNGAGSITRMSHVDYETWDPTWIKLVFEYGLVGAVIYIPFIISVFVLPDRSGFLKAALFLIYFFLSGAFGAPFKHILILVLLAWPATKSNILSRNTDSKASGRDVFENDSIGANTGTVTYGEVPDNAGVRVNPHVVLNPQR